MRFDEFLNGVDFRVRQTQEKWGDAFVRALTESRPDIAKELTASEYDPSSHNKGFYTARAINFVGRRWVSLS